MMGTGALTASRGEGLEMAVVPSVARGGVGIGGHPSHPIISLPNRFFSSPILAIHHMKSFPLTFLGTRMAVAPTLRNTLRPLSASSVAICVPD